MRWLWIIGGSAFAVFLMASFFPQSNFLLGHLWKVPVTAPMVFFLALVFLGHKAVSSKLTIPSTETRNQRITQ